MGFCESRFVRCFRFKTFSCEAIREKTYLRVHRASIDRSQILSFVDTPQRRDEDAESKRRTVSASKYRNLNNFKHRPYVFAYLNFCLAFAARETKEIENTKRGTFGLRWKLRESRAKSLRRRGRYSPAISTVRYSRGKIFVSAK